MELHVCPVCQGTGKQTVTVTEFGSDKPTDSFEMNCIGCDGTGKVNDNTLRMIEYERNMWCQCETDYGSHYVPDDTKNAAVNKHHYVCNKCGKVTQVG
jgi:hypothetical protein